MALTFSCSPHSEQNLAAPISGTPANRSLGATRALRFRPTIVQQYKANLPVGEAKDVEVEGRLGFCIFHFASSLWYHTISLLHYVGGFACVQDTRRRIHLARGLKRFIIFLNKRNNNDPREAAGQSSPSRL
jgi:hypothetical protein